MDQPLAGKRIAIMVANGFEETEMTEPQRALLKAGAALKTVSPEQGLVNGWHGKSWGHYFPVDWPIGEVLGADYDMLLLPGGERSITKLKQNAHTRRIVGHFLDAGKPIGAMDHGVELLAFAGKLKGQTVAATETVAAAVVEDGGTASEQPVEICGNLITAAGLDNLNSFVEQMVKTFAEAAMVKRAA